MAFLSSLMLLLFLAIPVEAAWHLYLAPTIGSGSSRADMIRPQYVSDYRVRQKHFHLGRQGYVLVAADTTPAQDAALSALPQVIKIPDNLDQQVGPALNTVQNLLEARNIPAGWITSNTTYRTILKMVMGLGGFLQRFPMIAKNWNRLLGPGGLDLNTQWGDIPPAIRQQLSDTAKSLNLDTSAITGTTTVRQLLKGISDQWIAAHPGGLKMGDIVIADASLWEKTKRVYRAFLREIEKGIAWATSRSDFFNRANASPLSGQWAIPTGFNPLQIVNGRVRIASDVNGGEYYTGFTPTDNQEAAISVPFISLAFAAVQLRQDEGTTYRYVAGCNSPEDEYPAVAIWTAAPEFTIIAINYDNWCVNGDRIHATVNGDYLVLMINGVVVEDGNDSTLTSGRCGIWLEGSKSAVEVDDFWCSDFGAPSVTAMPRRGLIFQ